MRVRLLSLSTKLSHPEAAFLELTQDLESIALTVSDFQVANDVVALFRLNSPILIIWNWKTGALLIVSLGLFVL